MTERKFQEDIVTLKEDMVKLRSDMTEIAKKLIDIGKTEAKEAKEKLETEARNLIDELIVELDEIGERGKKTFKTMEKEVKEKPLLSLILAFLVGFLIGNLLDRR